MKPLRRWGCAPSRRALLLAALPAFVLATTAHAQKPLKLPDVWYGVEVEDNVFTVQMPGIPDHRIVSDVSARGTPFQLHSYSVEAGGFSYVAQSALYPGDVDANNPRIILQAALDSRAHSLDGGKWSKVEWRTVGGATAVDSVGPVRGGSELRELVLLKGRRFVSLAFLGPAGTAGGPQAERFFKSLKLEP
ncbi:hypothetical protein SAMN02745126_02177 [Enhydrobacter aerosaccus]|uniref:Uncharacterized protein n=1 Tax=Enhydrobacter aerosaccus TaxID=225324 RepID=A0A1T4N982_9HYPH|nr:hypothetical protein [Enhydrobacter aerosaccus]SJZ75850.1 hypothetical protein SAMN02745126_02177 [Enhydrobacter aerosaccus]